jgi:TATA-binding protein-associated factor
MQEARVGKRGSAEAEAGLLALEGLHRSLMPFILRRTKGQVLQDLPPKIITDMYCDMGQLQGRLYMDFQSSKVSVRIHRRIVVRYNRVVRYAQTK